MDEKQDKQVKHSPISWVKKRSTLEKLLFVILLCFFIIVIVLAVLLGIMSGKISQADESSKLCLSQECVEAASRISKGIDRSVNPCDNFYDFACGGWIKSHVVPSDRSNLASYGVLRDEIQVILKQLLEEESRDDESSAVKKAKVLYQSCINYTQIEEADISVAYPLLREVGGWPVLGNKPGGRWDPNNFSLTKTLVNIMKYYNIPYLYPYVYKDTKNVSREIIYMENPGFILPERKYYLGDRDSPVLMALETLGRRVAMEFGADETVAVKDMRDVVDLEIDLANISMASEDRRDNEKLYNLYTLGELKNHFPESTKLDFSWKGYFQGIFGLKGIGINITDDEEIIIREVPYYSRLIETLEKYDKRVVANFAVWKLMKNRARNLPDRFLDHLGDYGKVLYGSPRVRARWRRCASYVVDYMGLPVGKLFVQKHFDEEAKKGMHNMIDKIEGAFREILSELSWMDRETRKVAIEKVEYITRRIGYDDDILDKEKLDRRYENVTVEPGDYFNNVLRMLKLSVIDELRGLRQSVYHLNWESAPSTVNAYYNAENNRIMFPAGILQPPYYNKRFPRSLNYGGIGSLIGHEITHGFDDRGRQNDKYGNLKQWWNDDAINKFKNLTQCLVKQYGDFSMPEAGGMKVNGIITLGENIADNGGMKQAFKAYRQFVDERGGEEDFLPGLSLTNNQLLFINFAQIRCAVMHRQDAVNHILTGPHSPSRFRIIGTLQNMPEFSEVFNCPKGSFMNPVKKCRVW